MLLFYSDFTSICANLFPDTLHSFVSPLVHVTTLHASTNFTIPGPCIKNCKTCLSCTLLNNPTFCVARKWNSLHADHCERLLIASICSIVSKGRSICSHLLLQFEYLPVGLQAHFQSGAPLWLCPGHVGNASFEHTQDLRPGIICSRHVAQTQIRCRHFDLGLNTMDEGTARQGTQMDMKCEFCLPCIRMRTSRMLKTNACKKHRAIADRLLQARDRHVARKRKANEIKNQASNSRIKTMAAKSMGMLGDILTNYNVPWDVFFSSVNQDTIYGTFRRRAGEVEWGF